jgi:glycosyltransferase 2 family protein
VLYGLPSTQWLVQSPVEFWLSVFAACGLSIVIGFVSLVPGGAGVRELVLTMILSPIVGPTAALCCAIWLRITWLVTELIMASLSYVVRWYVPSAEEPGTE